MPEEIRDNRKAHNLELEVDGHLATLHYRLSPGVVTFVHTPVPEALAGKGVGARLARHALDQARADGIKVVAQCPFVAAYMKRHPEYDDLKA
jgi:predicted GNAT family acetyltransferase